MLCGFLDTQYGAFVTADVASSILKLQNELRVQRVRPKQEKEETSARDAQDVRYSKRKSYEEFENYRATVRKLYYGENIRSFLSLKDRAAAAKVKVRAAYERRVKTLKLSPEMSG